jgi:hypothetical protein
MRDYTGVYDGAFSLYMKQHFGAGAENKDYYIVEDNFAIVEGDTKKEATALLGLPDKVTTTLEGYECWIYEDKGLELLFHEDRIQSWRSYNLKR